MLQPVDLGQIDVDVEGEFEEFIAARRALFAPFKGKSISVADAFALAEKLQGVYVQAGAVRVVTGTKNATVIDDPPQHGGRNDAVELS